MQCNSRPVGVACDESVEELDEVLRTGRVGDPAGDVAFVDIERGEQHHRAVSLIAVVATAWGCQGRAGLVGCTRTFGLDLGLLVHRPHHCVLGRVQIQAAHIGGFLPEVGIVAGHPRLGLPRFEIQRLADPPHLRRRDRTIMLVHPLGEGFHRPARRAVGWQLGDERHQPDHVVVGIDRRSPRAVLVEEPVDAELGEPATPHRRPGCNASPPSRRSPGSTRHRRRATRSVPAARTDDRSCATAPTTRARHDPRPTPPTEASRMHASKHITVINASIY